MQTGEWLKPGSLNTISYSIKLTAGNVKNGVLRFTKSQQERFQAFIEAGKEPTVPNGLDKSKDLELVEIVLNPNHEAPDFTGEDIEGALDLDQVVLLNRIWLERKVGNPRLSPELDPKFFA